MAIRTDMSCFYPSSSQHDIAKQHQFACWGVLLAFRGVASQEQRSWLRPDLNGLSPTVGVPTVLRILMTLHDYIPPPNLPRSILRVNHDPCVSPHKHAMPKALLLLCGEGELQVRSVDGHGAVLKEIQGPGGASRVWLMLMGLSSIKTTSLLSGCQILGTRLAFFAIWSVPSTSFEPILT